MLERAIQIRPNSAPLCNNLGEVYRQQGRFHEAEKLLRSALALEPRFPEAALNLGNTLRDLDQHTEAIEWFRRAIEWNPSYANAHLNLANALRIQGHFRLSIEHYQRYLRLSPPRADILLSMGGAHSELGETKQASDSYEWAAQLEPENSEIDAALGNIQLNQGHVDQATLFFQRIASRDPTCLLKWLRVESLCEPVPPSIDSIDRFREKLGERLEQLDALQYPLSLKDLHSSGAEPPMTLAYQGRNDRRLKERYARFFEQRIRPLNPTRPRGKPRLGVVVTSGHEGVYVECLGRLINRLADRGNLDVTVLCSRSGANILPSLLGKSVVRYSPMVEGVEPSAKRIQEEAFDLLHYWEVGTDSTNYFLPFFQPAPVQSACWGWPVTTGQSRIQYFVSSQLIEPPDGANHYTEQLVSLPILPTWYLRPPVVRQPRSRADFGWPEQKQIYLCTQNLRKYHPDFDPVIAQLLRCDPDGIVYAIDDSQPSLGRLLHSRFAGQFADVANRFVIIPRLPRIPYLNLVMLADVVLDTPHYGGGANSIYDAMACGTPIVTRPGEFHRGCYGAAVCRRLQLPELIVDSTKAYVDQALRIANDADFRESLKQKILERCPLLFEDDLAVDQHEQFFLKAISQSREG